jgi:hypothetical protein
MGGRLGRLRGSCSGASATLLRGVIEGGFPVAVSVVLILEQEVVLTGPQIEAVS